MNTETESSLTQNETLRVWHNHLPEIARLFFALFLPIALLLLGLTYLVLKIDTSKRIQIMQAQEASQVTSAANLIGDDIAGVTSDLMVLADAPSIRLLAEGHAEQTHAAAALFSVFVQNKGMYDQIRFLDSRGQELIRINWSEGRAMPVADEQLQDKGSRYYFQDSFQLEPGQIYVSPFDLNIEHGEIEQPFKPMLRIGTPLSDAQGRKTGILLINYLGERLLAHFRSAMNERHHAMLINREGYWLSHPDAGMEWGFMFRRQTTFGNLFPAEWSVILGDDEGSFMTPNGLFTFATVRPLMRSQHSSLGTAEAAGPSRGTLQAGDYFWKVVSRVPAEALPALSLTDPPHYGLLALAVVILLASGSGYLAVTLVSRRCLRKSVFDNETRLREITSTLGEGVYVLNTEGLVTFVNPEAEHLLQWRESDLLGRNGHDIFHHHTPDGRPLSHAECPVHCSIRSGKLYRTEQDWLIRKDGRSIPVSLVSAPIYRDQQVVGCVVAFQDITPRLETEAALRESEEKFRSAMEHAPIGMAIIGLDGDLLEVNRAFCSIVGYPRDELEQLGIETILHLEDLPAYREQKDRLIAGSSGVLSLEQRFVRRDGRIVWVQTTASLLRDQDGHPRHLLGQVEDVTARKQDQERIRQLAYYDALTDLPNRRLLLDHCQQALIQAKRFNRSLALMYLDLDHFKEINDTLGHDIGDLLLKETARRLQGCIRSGDSIARQGGDEFIILLSEIRSRDDAAMIARKILKALQNPVDIGGQRLQITVSIGIAVYPDPEHGTDEIQALLKQADNAMYRAKEAGRNRYRFFAGPA